MLAHPFALPDTLHVLSPRAKASRRQKVLSTRVCAYDAEDVKVHWQGAGTACTPRTSHKTAKVGDAAPRHSKRAKTPQVSSVKSAKKHAETAMTSVPEPFARTGKMINLTSPRLREHYAHPFINTGLREPSPTINALDAAQTCKSVSISCAATIGCDSLQGGRYTLSQSPPMQMGSFRLSSVTACETSPAAVAGSFAFDCSFVNAPSPAFHSASFVSSSAPISARSTSRVGHEELDTNSAEVLDLVAHASQLRSEIEHLTLTKTALEATLAELLAKLDSAAQDVVNTETAMMARMTQREKVLGLLESEWAYQRNAVLDRIALVEEGHGCSHGGPALFGGARRSNGFF